MVTMMMPSGAWTVVSAVVLGILLLAKLLTSSKYKNLPRGPRGLTIIGSLHLLGKFPQRDLTKLSETYRPLMSIWLGPRLAVVATSPAAARFQFCKSNRIFFFKCACSWRSFMTVASGKKLDEQDHKQVSNFRKILMDIAKYSQTINLGDFIPIFKWMDIFGLERQMRELRERIDAFMSPIISEHIVQRKSGSVLVKDMTDVLLDEMEDETSQFDITNDNINSTLWQLLEIQGCGKIL